MTQYQIAGRFAFGNVTGVQQFSMTRSRGIQPGTIQFVVPVIPQIPYGTVAPVFISDGIRNMTFPDCLLQSVDIDYSNGYRYMVTLLDFRWKWSYGEISGEYNTIRGGIILPSTRKKPQELAKLCLSEMGVRKYDIRQLPNDTYPEITWDLERPSAALESLCSSLGCTICPQIDGSVTISKNGVGKKLPIVQGAEMRESIKFGQVPDNIHVSASATVWEISLKIELPFGLERDKTGSVVPVENVIDWNKVSYKPPGGWGNEDPVLLPNVARNITNTDPRQAIKDRDRIRGLAQESIWKMFGFKFPFNLPGLPFPITNINQLIFLDDLLTQSSISYVSPSQGTVTELRRKKPFVYGRYYDRKDTGKNNVDKFSHEWAKDRKLIYPGGFSMDKDRGIIVMGDAVYLYDREPNAKEKYTVPELYFRTAVSVKDPETSKYYREVFKQKTAQSNNTKPLWVKRSDLRREINVDPVTSKPIEDGGDNEETLKKELTKYAKYELDKLETVNPIQGSYTGFIYMELDGCIEQVTYSIAESGETETTASYGYEYSLVIPSFDERRRIGMLNALIKQQDQLSNGKKDTNR